MADIALLNSQMAQRKTDAGGIRDALSAQLEAIKTEARREWQEKGINTEAEALKNPRLLYDLMLMAEIQAYIHRYTQKIGDYRVACDRLSYLYQQADDDLKIVSTLSGMKIDALVFTGRKDPRRLPSRGSDHRHPARQTDHRSAGKNVAKPSTKRVTRK